MNKPKIAGAPGLVWRPREGAWVATWQARSDLVKAGWWPKTSFLWKGTEPNEIDRQYIVNSCMALQDQMLRWSKNIAPVAASYDGTLGSLIAHYQTDPDSSYHKKRYHVRKNHDAHLARVVRRHGTTPLSDIKGRLLLAWHKEWLGEDGKKVAIAHMFIGHLRTLFTFGRTLLEDPECIRLGQLCHDMRFTAPRPRTERMTADQAVAIRSMAHQHGRASIALAQAFQFDLMLRQKDVLGEWVPMDEPGTSEIIRADGMKWITGLRWSEIDENFVLRHITSKRQKPIEIDLRLAPMVMEELGAVDRAALPASGPVVLCEATGQPWSAVAYRMRWRAIADAAGIPGEIRSMDSRAGAITEATDAGISLEEIRHAATHSDISTTQRYSRGSNEKVANVQRLRTAHRNKPKT